MSEFAVISYSVFMAIFGIAIIFFFLVEDDDDHNGGKMLPIPLRK